MCDNKWYLVYRTVQEDLSNLFIGVFIVALNWMDVTQLSFNSLLLLEEVQLSWLPGWLNNEYLHIALIANPHVEWYFRHKCPQLNDWLDVVLQDGTSKDLTREEIRNAEVQIMKSMEDLLVYVTNPAVYDTLPFTTWDDQALLELADFKGKTVIDVGAGTGRLSFAVAPLAKTVYAVEPVANLRKLIRAKADQRKHQNVYAVDGLITSIPFSADFADILLGGHVFGDLLEAEYAEISRVVKPGGKIILFPGNTDKDNAEHAFLVAHGFQWSRFEEPQSGLVRIYWKATA